MMKQFLCRVFGHRYRPWVEVKRNHLSAAAAMYLGSAEALERGFAGTALLLRAAVTPRNTLVFEYASEPGYVNAADVP